MSACSTSLTPRLIATEFVLSQWGQVRSIKMCGDARLLAICEPFSHSARFPYPESYVIHIPSRLNLIARPLVSHQGFTRKAIRVFHRLTDRCEVFQIEAASG